MKRESTAKTSIRPDNGSLHPQIAAQAAASRQPLSFLHDRFTEPGAYRRVARHKLRALLCYRPPRVALRPELVGRWETAEYIQEKVTFATAPGVRVPAYVLIPKKRRGRRPAIIDLHSHGGMFLYGKEKVMPDPQGDTPALARYRRENYDGRSTSLELCRRGYVVISSDCFYFGERRALHGDLDTQRDRSTYTLDEVRRFNERAAAGEATLAKGLFWAGSTWPGMVHWDDMRTLDYLITRDEVDPERIACMGISMGGDRSLYLAALDNRIRCAVVVGWMSTLGAMLQSHVATHSFVHFLPGMTRHLDLPDLAGCIAPRPLLVQQCKRDGLYTLEGMQAAVEKIAAIYRKAGAARRYTGRFYDETHRFTTAMQEDAFAWLGRQV